MDNERTDSPYELLIGTDDWSGKACCAGYYPDDMPDDWQLCYFSNLHRCVLLPVSSWTQADTQDAEQWLEDTDPEFMFIPVLEQEQLAQVEDTGNWKVLTLLQDQVPCLLARPSVSQLQQLQWLSVLLEKYDICVQLPQQQGVTTEQLREAVEAVCKTGASVLWDADKQSQPAECGRFLVTLAQTGDAAEQRRVIEKLSAWMEPDRRAALLFTGARAPYAAEQARTLAELMLV